MMDMNTVIRQYKEIYAELKHTLVEIDIDNAHRWELNIDDDKHYRHMRKLAYAYMRKRTHDLRRKCLKSGWTPEMWHQMTGGGEAYKSNVPYI